MKKFQFKKIHLRRGWWKSLLAAILCIGVIVGAGFGIASIFKPDQVDSLLDNKTLSPTIYRVGGLDSNGNYMNTDKSIYTKDAFECQGLNCTLNFDNEVTYQLYFYDQNNEFVHATEKLTGAFVQDSVPLFAKYARIVITPKEDNKVSLFEVTKYAKQLKTTVYREQGFKNFSEVDLSVLHADKKIDETGSFCIENGFSILNRVNLSDSSEILYFRTSGSGIINFAFYRGSQTFVARLNEDSSLVHTFTTSTGIKYCSVNLSELNSQYGAVSYMHMSVSSSYFSTYVLCLR